MSDETPKKPETLGDLLLDSDNPRLHDERNIGTIKSSLKDVGPARSIVIDEDNTILAGNGVTTAALQLGMNKLKIVEADGETIVAVRMHGLTQEQKTRLKVYDNRAGEQATWDAEVLLRISKDDPDLMSALFDKKDWAKLMQSIEKPDKGQADPGADLDRADELQLEWEVQKGDIWQLGMHRIGCGDCRDPQFVAELMQGERADITWTDPPWNVNYGATNHPSWRKRSIENDNLGDDFPQFCAEFCSAIQANSKPGAIIYMAMSAQEWPVIHKALQDAGFHWSSTIIWAKDQLVMSRKDYHTQYEPLWYGWEDSAPRIVEVSDRKQSDLWQIDRPNRSEEHPTMKPVELVARSLQNSSVPNALVFEPFSGSGTTIIAGEQLGRRVYAIELAEKYVAVALQRWSIMTGQEPTLVWRNNAPAGEEADVDEPADDAGESQQMEMPGL